MNQRWVFIIFGIVAAYYFFRPAPKKEIPEAPEVEEMVQEEVEIEEEEPEPDPQPAFSKKPLELKKPQQAKSPRAKYPNLDDSFAPFDAQGNRYIEQIVKVGKHLVYHGDVLLGKEEDLPKLLRNQVVKKGKSRKWPGGKIPFEIDSNIQQEDKVIEALEYLNTFTNIRIVPRENEEDYVLITAGEQDCYSYAGRIGGMQEIFLVPQCGVREIIHEWMHTLGFFHEQNREDRDRYLKIVWENIDEVNRPQFKKLPNDFIGLVGRPFDFNSIMLYSSESFSSVPGEPSMLTADGQIIPRSQSLLSDEDIKRVNLAYPSVQ